MSNNFPEEDEVHNQRLQQLVQEAQNYSPSSDSSTERGKRRIALHKLIAAIQSCGKLSKQSQWLSLPNYEDYYHEALQQTFIEICQKIDQYDPQYPVMAWVNKIFNWRFHDVVKKDQRRGFTQLPKNPGNSQVLSLDDLNKEVPIDNEISEEEQLKEIIENDPDIFLTNEYIKGHPQASLKVIILLLLSGKKLKEISEELDVPMTTASSFYQRRLHKIIDYLQKYI